MIRVALINDFPLINNLIVASLEDEPDIQIVKTIDPSDNMIRTIEEQDIDIVLISGRISSVKAINLVSKLDTIDPELEVLLLGLEEKEDEVLSFFEAGATGYIKSDASVEELVSAIHTAYKGRTRVSPHIARSLIERVYHLTGEFEGLNESIFDNVELTPREMDVLALLGENLTNQEIAERMFIEVGTVKNHVHSILQKLEVNSRHEAAKYLTLLKR